MAAEQPFSAALGTRVSEEIWEARARGTLSAAAGLGNTQRNHRLLAGKMVASHKVERWKKGKCSLEHPGEPIM